MRLLVSDLSLPVRQMGADFLLVHQPVNHPPAQASLVLRVDGSERCWNVHLPHGIAAGTNRVAIERSA
jgi:hypothetical protein